jgi:hypothetical protein
MPLSFKLVGFTLNKKNYELKDSYEGNINLSIIHELFMSWHLSREEVQEIKFIIDSEQIKDYEKSYYINPDEIYNIFIFVFNQNIREKLQIIFITYGLEVSAINDQDGESIESEEDTPELTLEIIKEINEQTMVLFSDPDFINLINIYKRKPELFNLLSNYIQNNDLVIESLITNKNVDQLSEDDKLYYTNLSIKIIDFGFKIPQETIIDRLIKYSGHLNLTIRSLIYDN